MAYTPINTQMYNAAFTGALGGMLASGRVPTNASQGSYGQAIAVVGAWAKSLDVAWNNAATSNALEVYSAKMASEGVWQNRTPATNDPLNLVSTTFDVETAAIVAMILAGDAYYAAQGITPPPIGGGGRTLSGDVIFTDPGVSDDTHVIGIHGSPAVNVGTSSFIWAQTGTTALDNFSGWVGEQEPTVSMPANVVGVRYIAGIAGRIGALADPNGGPHSFNSGLGIAVDGSQDGDIVFGSGVPSSDPTTERKRAVLKTIPNGTPAGSFRLIDAISFFQVGDDVTGSTIGALRLPDSNAIIATRDTGIGANVPMLSYDQGLGRVFIGNPATAFVGTIDSTGAIDIVSAAGNVAIVSTLGIASLTGATIALNATTQSTVGAAGGADALPATPTGYLNVSIAGSGDILIPFYARS